MNSQAQLQVFCDAQIMKLFRVMLPSFIFPEPAVPRKNER
jgi:hypothetical protein